MINFDDALETVLRHAVRTNTIRVPLDEAVGYVLARPVRAKRDMPRFDQSAVDGFALQAADVAGASASSPIRLRLIETRRAGKAVSAKVVAGTAVRVFTGSEAPQGADAVVMREYVAEAARSIRLDGPVAGGENIRRRGEEFRRGDEALPAGTRITPPALGFLAALNRTSVTVRRKPAVTCIITGDEVVPPGSRLGPGQVHDANGYALHAALRELGIDRLEVWHARDDVDLLAERLREALDRSDVVITSGGASVGDDDPVRAACRAAGVREVFWKIAIKPGKPVLFGTFSARGRRGTGDELVRKRLFFGLPGNPVSVLVTYHQVVKPALLAMMGGEARPTTYSARLCGKLRARSGRVEWVRGVVRSGGTSPGVEPTKGQGSHMLGGLARANCLIVLPGTLDRKIEDEPVEIQPISWKE